MTGDISSPTEEDLNLDALAKNAGIALVIRFGGICVTYLVQVFLARWMGKTEYGIYEYVIAWSVLLAIPAGLGFPHTVLRFVAEYEVKEEWGLLRGIISSSWLITVLASLLVSLLTASVILLLNYHHPFTYATPLLFGIGLIPLQALVNLQLETARSLKDVTLAYAPAYIIWPVLLICGAFLVLETTQNFTTNSVIILSQIALLVAVLVQLGLLWLKLIQEFTAVDPVYAIREWLSVAFIVSLQSACFIILSKTDTILIGLLLGPEDAGVYSAAVKTAEWVSAALVITNIVAAPYFTALYTKGDIKGLQNLVSTVALWIFWSSFVVALLLIIFSQTVLGIFGSGFVGADWPLKILVLGQLMNAWCGSVIYLMIMTGHQNKSVVVIVFATVVNIIGDAILIPLMGTVGAAIATAFCYTLWNIWLSVLVMRYVGVNPLAFRGLLPWNFSNPEAET